MMIAKASQSWLLFWGHFHPMLVHLPIGMFFMAGILHFFKQNSDNQGIVVRILIWTTVFSILAASMGWGLAESGEYDPNTLQIHQWLGICTCLLSVGLTYALRADWNPRISNALFILGLSCLTITGHYGGNLTHGSEYLTESLPASARNMLGMKPISDETQATTQITNLPEALVYHQLVKPVLSQKCISCHNAEKQKGKLRLDSPEFIMSGGEDGPIILAGKPLESEMIKRLMLDAGDEHHMPPKGKTPLTENEIALLHWWVQHGADFNKKVSELPLDAKIKPVLNAYTQKEESLESPVYQLSVDPADESDLERLRRYGLRVNPISKDHAWIEVNAVNAPQITNKELADLKQIQNQIVRLKLGNTRMNGAFMKEIASMPHLILLDVNHTKMANEDLESLQNLAYLETINLVSTPISDAALMSLAKIKSLKQIYVWQSRVTEKGIEQFKKMRPNIKVQIGFKGNWPLEVDTAKLMSTK